MKVSLSKKILILGLILLIIAGVVVIALKGLNVDLLTARHESINLRIGEEVNLNEFRKICKDVFGNKKIVVRKLELFGESVNICVESITDEEKEALANKLNEVYLSDETEESNKYTADTISVNTIPNIRIRDIINPYIRPIIIVGVIVVGYMLIRFRKTNSIKIIGKLVLELVLTEAALLSIIAITRIPVSSIAINCMFAFGIIELLIYNIKLEKNR